MKKKTKIKKKIVAVLKQKKEKEKFLRWKTKEKPKRKWKHERGNCESYFYVSSFAYSAGNQNPKKCPFKFKSKKEKKWNIS